MPLLELQVGTSVLQSLYWMVTLMNAVRDPMLPLLELQVGTSVIQSLYWMVNLMNAVRDPMLPLLELLDSHLCHTVTLLDGHPYGGSRGKFRQSLNGTGNE